MDDLHVKYERRVKRERNARMQAEDLLEVKSRALYESNQALRLLTRDLEQRVSDRTRELEQAQRQAVSLAEQDQLTGIANRMLFGRMIEQAIAFSEAMRQPFALFLIDLDNFKDINDGFGHEAGDVLLRETASRLTAVLHAPDEVARVGGDEFAVILVSQASLAEMAAIAGGMIESLGRPITHRNHVLEVSCSIGIALYPDHAREAGELQRYADLALYRSKAAGRAEFTIFDDSMRREYDERHLLGSELKNAIETGLVEPWFQPIVDARTECIVGVEALARWLHPKTGVLPPDTFLRLAEERGLMNDLFAAMLKATCAATRPWIEDGLIRFASINVSPSQFKNGLLVDLILRTLEAMNYPAAALTIEITEDLLLNDFGRARAQLERLADAGVCIALDDFGVGYSNIGYLRRLPIHKLKIDRLLTVDVTRDHKARGILSAIVEIARALDLEIIAEGIEAQDQATWLGHLGCQNLQGFLFGRPTTGARLDRFMRGSRGDRCRIAAGGVG